MRIVNVNGVPPLIYTCCSCGCSMNSKNETVFADLDGEPFKAYYCNDCMVLVEKEADKKNETRYHRVD